MLIKKAADLRESDVTPKELYLRRREFIAAAGVHRRRGRDQRPGPVRATPRCRRRIPSAQKLPNLKKSPFSTDEKLNSYKDITTYNNFYEFGLDKADPAKYAQHAQAAPVERGGRRAVRQARHLQHRRHHEVGAARRAHLPPSLRRGVVDGDAVGRLSAERVPQALRADVEGEVRRVQDARRPEADAGPDRARAATGRTSRACAWTKPCTR